MLSGNPVTSHFLPFTRSSFWLETLDRQDFASFCIHSVNAYNSPANVRATLRALGISASSSFCICACKRRTRFYPFARSSFAAGNPLTASIHNSPAYTRAKLHTLGINGPHSY